MNFCRRLKIEKWKSMGQDFVPVILACQQVLSSWAQTNSDPLIFGVVWRTFIGFPRLLAENFGLLESQVKGHSSLQVAADFDGECDRAARVRRNGSHKD
jgi:hypothetical protein